MLSLETEHYVSAAAGVTLPAFEPFVRNASANSAPSSAGVALAFTAFGTATALLYRYIEDDRRAPQAHFTMPSPGSSFGQLLWTGATTIVSLGWTTSKMIAMANDIAMKASREDALQKIVNFAYGADWAGPSTVLPNDSTQMIARTFIEGLPTSIPTPHVSLGADGTIGFEWETRKDYFAVEIEADVGVVWMHRRQGKTVAGGEEPWSGRIPDTLSERLNQTFS